jgi:hypothetical protein
MASLTTDRQALLAAKALLDEFWEIEDFDRQYALESVERIIDRALAQPDVNEEEA